MNDIAIAATALVALVAAPVVTRNRRSGRRPLTKTEPPPPAPRSLQLELQIGSILAEFRTELFRSYDFGRIDGRTRLGLQAAPRWKQLSELTRIAVLRRIWQAVDALAAPTVVVVDSPRQQWSAETEARLTITAPAP